MWGWCCYRRGSSISEARKVKEKYESQLRAIPGVIGVGYNGSINVYVEKLTSEISAFIPSSIDGVRVNIKETGGKFRLLSLVPVTAIYAGRVGRFRPAPGGVSVGHPEVTAGTLTCRAKDKVTDEVFGLSNNHIVALDWGEKHIGKKGDPTLQPGVYDGGKLPDDKIGELERWEPVRAGEGNLIDAGLFYSDKLSSKIEEIGEPDQCIEPYVGMKVVKSGRSSGITYGKIIDVDATVDVEGYGVCRFVNQVLIEPAVIIPGDSGSWIGEADSFRSVAHGFAGSPLISVASRVSEVERILGVEIIPPLDYLGLGSMMTPFFAGAVIANLGGKRNGY